MAFDKQFEGRLNAIAVMADVFHGDTVYVDMVKPDTDVLKCPFIYADGSGTCVNTVLAKVGHGGMNIAACSEHLGQAVEIVSDLYPCTKTGRR